MTSVKPCDAVYTTGGDVFRVRNGAIVPITNDGSAPLDEEPATDGKVYFLAADNKRYLAVPPFSGFAAEVSSTVGALQPEVLEGAEMTPGLGVAGQKGLDKAE